MNIFTLRDTPLQKIVFLAKKSATCLWVYTLVRMYIEGDMKSMLTIGCMYVPTVRVGLCT